MRRGLKQLLSPIGLPVRQADGSVATCGAAGCRSSGAPHGSPRPGGEAELEMRCIPPAYGTERRRRPPQSCDQLIAGFSLAGLSSTRHSVLSLHLYR